MLSLLTGRPAGGQYLLTAQDINDDDLEIGAGIAHIGGQAEGVVAEGRYQGIVRFKFCHFQLRTPFTNKTFDLGDAVKVAKEFLKI